ncbi:DUF2244 domain-containing protein [Hyphobacterium sp. HN65]|uniref:DUF2244 domain-containing protein n=1 Tax=Hyphobacterium lacteum TaxID=3116575 RepID=A0ABU7LRX0_9PROT|nr:DUF2244 domain-containing protein [Hyphobacterium sp. HN65]MEE2526648.1 DUF2244 domain-containing protein [Hyphobacterium sp. HN65]
MRNLIETCPAEPGLPDAPEEPLFMDAVLAPNRSLPNPGFIVLMAVLCGVSFAAGLAYWRMGAWPIPFFFGLDVALVWMAFKVSYRDGRRREIIRIARDRILVHRQHPNGAVRHYVLPTAWTKVRVHEAGKHDAAIELSASGKRLIVGSFLSPAERPDLGEAIGRAIRKATLPAPQESGGAGHFLASSGSHDDFKRSDPV